jgi:hypothetical protein
MVAIVVEVLPHLEVSISEFQGSHLEDLTGAG